MDLFAMRSVSGLVLSISHPPDAAMCFADFSATLGRAEAEVSSQSCVKLCVKKQSGSCDGGGCYFIIVFSFYIC
jgi:hypothetical protein